MKLDTKDYLYWGRWLQPVLPWSFLKYWSLSESAKNIPLELNYELTPALNIDGHHYIKLNKFYYNLVNEFLFELTSNKKPLLDYFFREAEKTDKNIADFLENNEYGNDFDKIINAFDIHGKIMFSWAVIVPLDHAINKKSEELCNKYNLSWDKVINSVPLPFKSLSFRDNEKLLEFKKELEGVSLDQQASIEKLLKKNETLAKEIINYQKKTEYIGTHHFWGDPRKIEDLMMAIINSSSQNLEEVRERPGNIPEELLHVAEICVAVSTWRLQIAERVAQLEYSIREELTRLAIKLNIVYEDIIFLTDKEIIDIFEKDSLTSEMKLEIKKRKNKFASTMGEGNELLVWTGKEYLEIERKFLKKDKKIEDILELKGFIGSGGKVRGKVSIVLEPKDMQKVEKDSVLVSPATSPDYFPVMKLAKAIVTDEGGITSHAAIVAREMKKPCIIGTKIATQVLKDGDEVEVDAEKGIVKIIKNKS